MGPPPGVRGMSSLPVGSVAPTHITTVLIEPAKNAYLPYDVSPDGERFIFILALPGEAVTPTVVTGWSVQLPR